MPGQAPSRVDRRRAHAVRLALVAVITMIVPACGGGGGDDEESSESTSQSKPIKGSTAWERVLDGIGDDGTVSTETALAAFSLAIAPLPGVDVPEGDPGPIPDGSGAVAWVLRHYDELTPEQQQAVGAALGGEASDDSEKPTHSLRAPGFSSDVQLAVSSSPSTGCYGQPVVTEDSPGSEKYRALVDEMVDKVGSRLSGITMNLQTFVVLETKAAPKDTSDAFTWADRSDCSSNTAQTCTIHFNPAAQADSNLELRAVVAHEVTHCYIFAYLGVQAYDLPPWIGEGIPGWVGETIAGGTPVSARWWRRYLTDPGKALFGRVYDAIGFYAHLDESGSDPFQKAVPMLDASDNQSAWQAAVGAANSQFLDSWPSGFAREPSRGSVWDTRMAGITNDKAPLTKRAIGNGQSLTEASPPGANRIVGLAINGDVMLVDSDSSGRLAGSGDEIVLRNAGPLCLLGNGCECPPETPGNPESTTDFENPEVLAVTGGLDQGVVKLQVISLEDWCGSPVDPCMIGRWVSTKVEITDETTGAPVTELGGGDGVVMTIARDGKVVIDHNGMSPIRSDVSGIIFQTTVRGVSNATIKSRNGQVEVVTNDFATTATAQVQTGGLASRPLAGTPLLGTGTYQCSSTTLDLSSPYPLGTAKSSFQKQT